MYKPDSVLLRTFDHKSDYHLSSSEITLGIQRPTLLDYTEVSEPSKSIQDIFGLSALRVYLHVPSLAQVVSSYLAFSPLPIAWRFIFCDTFHC